MVYRTVYPLCWSPWIGWIPDPVTPPLAPLAAWSHGRSWQLRQQNRTSRPGRRSPWYRPTSKYLEMLHWSTDIYSGCEVWIYFSARFSESLVSLMHNLENLPSFICFCWRYNLTVSWCWLQLQIIEFSLVNIHTIGHSEYSDSEWILNFKKIVHFSPILAKSGRCKLLALRCSEPWHLTIPCRPRSSKQRAGRQWRKTRSRWNLPIGSNKHKLGKNQEDSPAHSRDIDDMDDWNYMKLS